MKKLAHKLQHLRKRKAEAAKAAEALKQEIITAALEAAKEAGVPCPPKMRELKNNWDRDISPAQLREALEELKKELQDRLQTTERALGTALKEKEELEGLVKEFLN